INIGVLKNASEADHTLVFVADLIVQDRKTRRPPEKWYNSRDLVRVKRSIAMLRVIFEQILKNNREDSLTGPVNVAYDNILAPYHSYIANRFVHLFTMVEDLPTMEKLLEQLGETWDSAVDHMDRYVQASNMLQTTLRTYLTHMG
ncbi:unnamed protein product, partial [Ilex paraguariensis]